MVDRWTSLRARTELPLRDARVHSILEGTNETLRVVIARHLLDTSDELQ